MSKPLRELEEVQVLINKLDFEDSFTAEKFVFYNNFKIITEMISDDEILKAEKNYGSNNENIKFIKKSKKEALRECFCFTKQINIDNFVNIIK
ncbi:hypothetical protein RhiirA4_468835 [Rhizophagus irregularis]|uniref:Uncharacterized protein n=1 Tax=Rhizophagus irregularis TaxID=588596 RepID=A0A2I1GYF9_9GLOM|nr:hypothetical protein RhiirA4_468835 [Rhizophagus irregularis]